MKGLTMSISKKLVALFSLTTTCPFAFAFLNFFSPPTYDFYRPVDPIKCDSSLSRTPSFSLTFKFKKETNEIFAISEFTNDSETKNRVVKLENCSIVDAENWSCGGNSWGPNKEFRNPIYTLAKGKLTYEEGYNPLSKLCKPTVVKR